MDGVRAVCRAAAAAQRQHAKEWLDARQALPDHVEAAISVLQGVIDRMRAGASPEDVGPTVILLGRMMARRT